MARTIRRTTKSSIDESAPEGALPVSTSEISPATNSEQSNGSKSFPSKTMLTVDKGWMSQDLDLLKSGLFADAEICCCEASIRKVHRNILAARSDWFKKKFAGSCTVEERNRGIVLRKTPFEVDLVLYFFYSGGIDMADKALTNGHSVMEISIELLRLGNYFESKIMQDYGKGLLTSYLGELLDHICDTNATDEVRRDRFEEQTAFPRQFCAAVSNACDADRPIKHAQGILADFAFAARTHLFKNVHFKVFIASKQALEFATLVLTAQMYGGVSDVFRDNSTFMKWKNWEINPSSAPST